MGSISVPKKDVERCFQDVKNKNQNVDNIDNLKIGSPEIPGVQLFFDIASSNAALRLLCSRFFRLFFGIAARPADQSGRWCSAGRACEDLGWDMGQDLARKVGSSIPFPGIQLINLDLGVQNYISTSIKQIAC